MNESKPASIHIFVQQEMSSTPQELLAVMLDHVNLSRFFNAEFSVIKAENTAEAFGGKGCIRQVSSGKQIFKEEITAASDNGFSYQIIGSGPVTEHRGNVVFIHKGPTTEVQYNIEFNGPKWIPDFLVKFIVTRDMKQALKKLANFFR